MSLFLPFISMRLNRCEPQDWRSAYKVHKNNRILIHKIFLIEWIHLGWCFLSIWGYKCWTAKYLQFSNAGNGFRQSEEGEALNIKYTATLEGSEYFNPTNLGPYTSHQHNSCALSWQFSFPKNPQKVLVAADHVHRGFFCTSSHIFLCVLCKHKPAIFPNNIKSAMSLKQPIYCVCLHLLYRICTVSVRVSWGNLLHTQSAQHLAVSRHNSCNTKQQICFTTCVQNDHPVYAR